MTSLLHARVRANIIGNKLFFRDSVNLLSYRTSCRYLNDSFSKPATHFQTEFRNLIGSRYPYTFPPKRCLHHESPKNSKDTLQENLKGTVHKIAATAETVVHKRYFGYELWVIIAFSIPVVVIIIYAAWEFIYRDKVAGEISNVVTISLSDETLQLKTRDFTIDLLRMVFNNKQIQREAVNFLEGVFQYTETQTAVKSLLLKVISMPETKTQLASLLKDIVNQSLADPQFRAELAKNLKFLLADENTKRAVLELLEYVLNDDDIKTAAKDFAREIIAAPLVQHEASILGQKVFDDVVNDDVIRRHTGDGLRQAVFHAVTPSPSTWFGFGKKPEDKKEKKSEKPEEKEVEKKPEEENKSHVDNDKQAIDDKNHANNTKGPMASGGIDSIDEPYKTESTHALTDTEKHKIEHNDDIVSGKAVASGVSEGVDKINENESTHVLIGGAHELEDAYALDNAGNATKLSDKVGHNSFENNEVFVALETLEDKKDSFPKESQELSVSSHTDNLPGVQNPILDAALQNTLEQKYQSSDDLESTLENSQNSDEKQETISLEMSDAPIVLEKVKKGLQGHSLFEEGIIEEDFSDTSHMSRLF